MNQSTIPDIGHVACVYKYSCPDVFDAQERRLSFSLSRTKKATEELGSFATVTLVCHLFAIPIGFCLYVYYLQPEKIFAGTAAAVTFSLLYFLYSANLQRFFGFNFVSRYVLTLWRFAAPAIVIQVSITAGSVFWMIAIFGNFVDRLQYVQHVKESLEQIELGSLVVPAPKKLAAAFSLYPGRREIPFLIVRASRTLTFSDNQRFFSEFMTEFVNHLDHDKLEKYYRSSDPLSAGSTRIFVSNSFVQASYSEDGLQRSIDYISASEQRTDQEELFLNVLDISKAIDGYFGQILHAQLDLGRLCTNLAQIEHKRRILETITENAQTKIDQNVFRYANSHIFQQALDTLAQIEFLSTLCVSEETERLIHIDRGLQMYRRILVLRDRLVSKDSILWFTTPGTLTIYNYFDAKSGRRNSVADNWVKILRNINPDILRRINQDIFAAPAFSKFKDLDFWTEGTPQATRFRGTGSKDLLETWLKEGW